MDDWNDDRWHERVGPGDLAAAALAAASRRKDREWGRSVMAALESVEADVWAALGLPGLLTSTARAVEGRQPMPFDGFMEAPSKIVELYQKHGHRLRDLDGEMWRTLDELLLDISVALADALEGVTWADLREHGVTSLPPEPVVH